MSGALVNFVVLILTLSSIAIGQRLAVLTPDSSIHDESYSSALSNALTAEGAKLTDRSLAASVFASRNLPTPFNLTVADGKNIAAGIGCEYLVIVRAQNLRRASFSRPDYDQASASIYLVSGRTGVLVNWQLPMFEAATRVDAESQLIRSAPGTAKDLLRKIRINSNDERNEGLRASIEEVPDADSPDAKASRPPVPYQRIKPAYTQLASLFNVQATVDVLVDISAAGEVVKTEIVRWAGFGLDESVVNTIRKMNWRPAMRNGKPLPMRVLLRYNFTKIDDEQ